MKTLTPSQLALAKILAYCHTLPGLVGMRTLETINKVALMRLDGWGPTWIDDKGNQAFPWHDGAKLNPRVVLHVADTWEDLARDLELID